MTIYESAYPSIEVPQLSVTQHVLRHADRLADKPALIDGPTGRTLTYGQLRDRIHSLAGGLAARGVGKGTTLALMSPNLPEYAVVFHAIALTGATVTTLNPTYGAKELAFQLRDAKASWIITIGLFAETAGSAADAVNIGNRVLIGPAQSGWEPLTDLFGAPLSGQAPVAPDDVVVLPYSSGTTGFPKGVMLTHHNLVANLLQTEAPIALDEDEVVFAVLPFFHIYGMTVLMNYSLARGATVVTVPRFDLVQMLELTQQRRITRLFLVPPIVLALARHPIIDRYDLSSVKQIFSGAAPLGGELAEDAARRCGCTVAQGYGMTELSPVSHAIQEGVVRPGSSGTLLPNTRARLVDPETGKDCAAGEEGELWISGPQVMAGYLENPEATAQTIDAEGWLHTGDIARIDEEGHLYIVDRLKELIKVSGFQVPPAELEALLIQHPAVADVAVIGIPDERTGERPKAFVVRAAGTQASPEELSAYVAEHVSTYKQVKHFDFVDAIPKSASGKILRRVLRAG